MQEQGAGGTKNQTFEFGDERRVAFPSQFFNSSVMLRILSSDTLTANLGIVNHLCNSVENSNDLNTG
jgi:hypothetical protein